MDFTPKMITDEELQAINLPEAQLPIVLTALETKTTPTTRSR